jgi:hypothetical protein
LIIQAKNLIRLRQAAMPNPETRYRGSDTGTREIREIGVVFYCVDSRSEDADIVRSSDEIKPFYL